MGPRPRIANVRASDRRRTRVVALVSVSLLLNLLINLGMPGRAAFGQSPAIPHQVYPVFEFSLLKGGALNPAPVDAGAPFAQPAKLVLQLGAEVQAWERWRIGGAGYASTYPEIGLLARASYAWRTPWSLRFALGPIVARRARTNTDTCSGCQGSFQDPGVMLRLGIGVDWGLALDMEARSITRPLGSEISLYGGLSTTRVASSLVVVALGVIIVIVLLIVASSTDNHD